MTGVLVFVPVAPGQAASLLRDGSLPGCQAFSVTPALRETLGHGPAEAEDSEYACLVLASVHGLATHGRRLVLVAEVAPATVKPGEETENGGVRLTGLARSSVRSFFTDEDPQPLAEAAATAIRGMGLDQAWETEQVQALVRGADLLWHAVEELPILGEDV
ncbi:MULTISPECIES: DUF6912 family protein [unclassified Luteococcus]|uniref:DUF6912 family protein n=1 Tax=unclassified Luteococcus TaxID=2639923 RepID=UPI00313D3AF4